MNFVYAPWHRIAVPVDTVRSIELVSYDDLTLEDQESVLESVADTVNTDNLDDVLEGKYSTDDIQCIVINTICDTIIYQATYGLPDNLLLERVADLATQCFGGHSVTPYLAEECVLTFYNKNE